MYMADGGRAAGKKAPARHSWLYPKPKEDYLSVFGVVNEVKGA